MRARRAVTALTAAAAVAVPAALAVGTARFAVLYRERAGFPPRPPVVGDPGDLGLAWEAATVTSARRAPARVVHPVARRRRRPAGRRPGVVLVHGWGSNRARMLPIAAFLHAAGFHTLAIDVRGHGDNPPETLPVTGVVFGEDAAAAVETLAARPDVTAVGIVGHSMGGVGAALAAAATPEARAAVVISAPADPRLLVRETFRMADLRLPDVVAAPLAWASLRSVLRPRGHRPREASARDAVAATDAALLVIQGDADEILPLRDVRILERAAASRGAGTVAEVLVVPGGRHRWLYEDRTFRAAVAGFLARNLAGGGDPVAAADAAAAVEAVRPSDTEGSLVPKEAHGHDHGDRHAPDRPQVLA